MPQGAEEGTAAQPAPGLSAIPGGKVFISYASQDTDIANALCNAFERAGIPCWIAPRDVQPGDFYADAIVQAIAAAPVFVLILSRAAIDSPHVLREIARASSKKRRIIAFRIDVASLPPGLEYFLSASQWLDASGGPPERRFPHLIEAVRTLGSSSIESTPAHTVAAPLRRNRKAPLVAATAVIAITSAYYAVDRFWLSKRAVPEQPAALSTPPAAAPIADKSVAVLPFLDMSEKKDQEYFSDGLSEELIDMLTKMPGLHDADQTFVWLDRAYSAHDYVWYIRSDPNFEPIRSDPRYTQLLKKWGLIT
jgi:hypothetical protein